MLNSLLLQNLQAEPIQIKFDKIRLNDFSRIVLEDVLQKNYIMYDGILTDDKPITINYKAESEKHVLSMLEKILLDRGFQLDQKNDSYYLKPYIPPEEKKTQPDQDTVIYNCQNRTSLYLIYQVQNVFDDLHFSSIRKQQQGQDVNNVESPRNLDAFVITGDPKKIRVIQSLLERLDTPQNQAQITAYLVEVTNQNTDKDALSIIANLLSSKLSITLAADTLANSIKFATGSITAVISALSTDSRFNVSSSPSILVKDREHGKFTVGQDVPVLGQITQDGNGRVTQSVNYRSSGVLLDFQPVFTDKAIDLKIAHELSNFVQTDTGVNNSPTLIKRSIETTVKSGFDDVILLGGLTETKYEQTAAGWKLLPMFGANQKTNTSSNIVLMLHVKKI